MEAPVFRLLLRSRLRMLLEAIEDRRRIAISEHDRCPRNLTGFRLLPSFKRPHYTIRLANDDQAELTRLLSAQARPSAIGIISGGELGGR